MRFASAYITWCTVFVPRRAWQCEVIAVIIPDRQHAKSAERYAWYKAHGICVTCGREDAMLGRVRCFDCLEKERKRQGRYRERKGYKASKKQANARRAAARKENGQCIACARPAVPGKVRCQFCLSKDARNHKHAEWKPPGECLYCKEPHAEGKKLCEKHLLIAQKSIANARKHINREEHPWRQELFGRIG